MNTNIIEGNPTKKFFIEMITRDISIEDAIIDLLDNSIDGANKISPDDYSNLFIETVAGTEEELEEFLALPYEHKICFTTIPCFEKDVFYIQDSVARQKYANKIGEYANNTVMKQYLELKEYDLLKLLNNESDFRRVEY